MNFEFEVKRDIQPYIAPGEKLPTKLITGKQSFSFRLDELNWRQRISIAIQALRGWIKVEVGEEGTKLVVA